ncbi:alpha/beta hydrolase [Phenylobacterium sp.]|uniref:alpha/beta hydrolase n=1 Tax=Phenylobacterium sp. TaxID=1871053 RepID=UPI0025EA3A56|nr:alpha/beta hydrolase [Phenylobacterium sp.]
MSATDSLALDEGFFLEVGGLEQWVTVRGRDAGNPALMILPGAGAGLSAVAPFFAAWEADFTLVHWDQPGAGYTGATNPGDRQPLTYARLARDGLAVAQAVKARCGLKRLALLATSGGTIVALKMARTRPELFSAYIGNGQIVTRAQQETLSYRMVLARAEQAGDGTAVDELTALGPPPYADPMGDLIKSGYANAATAAEGAAWAELMDLAPPSPGARHAPPNAPALDTATMAFSAYRALRGELAAFDARKLGLTFGLPMYFIQGEADAHTVSSAVVAYAAELAAPDVDLALIPGEGHLSFFLRAAMLERLLALRDRLMG